MIGFLVVLLISVLVFGMVSAVAGDYFSTGEREIRKGLKRDRRVLAEKQRQLNAARAALYKIADPACGNPTLEAQLALEKLNENELKEMES